MQKNVKLIVLSLLMTVVLLGSLTVFTACDSDDSKKEFIIITTIYPEYDWVKNIAIDNDNIDIKLLLNGGVDLHSYEPTVKDIAEIASCDMFIYVGGESDAWADDCLKNATNKNLIVINLIEVLGDYVKNEEVKEGMEGEHSEGISVSALENSEEEEEKDEHVWLSIKNSKIICREIANKLGVMDQANAEKYTANATNYIEKLAELDNQYKSAVDSANKKTILVADRFPFRYLVDDYGINYYAAFVGCSAETEASFETITFLANKVNELDLSVVLKIDNSTDSLANTVITASKKIGVEILKLNSMQAITSSDISNGATYISIMENNLEVLKDALK